MKKKRQGALNVKFRGLIVLLALAVAGCAGGNDSGGTGSGPSASAPQATPTESAVPETGGASVPPSPSEATEPPMAVLNPESLSGLFGFADEQGTRLMALTDGMEPETAGAGELESYRLAIGEGGGQTLRIRYEKHQTRTEQDNGRQSSYNFDNMEGDIYTIEEGKATPNESYFLVTEEQFDVQALIPLKPSADRELPDEAAKKIAEAKGRAIEQGWLLAHAQDGQRIYAVQYQRQGDDMLASLVWEDGERLVFLDYPAVYDEF